MRFIYCACAVSYMLNDWSGKTNLHWKQQWNVTPLQSGCSIIVCKEIKITSLSHEFPQFSIPWMGVLLLSHDQNVTGLVNFCLQVSTQIFCFCRCRQRESDAVYRQQFEIRRSLCSVSRFASTYINPQVQMLPTTAPGTAGAPQEKNLWLRVVFIR